MDKIREAASFPIRTCLLNPDNPVNPIYTLAFAPLLMVTLSAQLTTICGLKASKIGRVRWSWKAREM